ncbi:LuxR C-terminal-related transcriptional regulator [Microcella sp.]|uniref:LuxR C-terminal-related transcriptional regulator n=1 Tax=Microcella sp. TaxID=1913979 RepID=UPI002566FC2F|nr:LuxR C-terminal-related transcriptional regulator [Microcella sp.]MBX9472206.1 NACHT domain-containing protein [Microcella sp.]
MPPWPLVARTDVLDSLIGGLTGSPSRAQLLRGASGVGKTTLAASVASTLVASGRTVVPIVALEELRSVPLGALAPLLATARGDTASDVGTRLNELMALVGRHAREYLLVVDDAPLLDEASAAALYQLVRVFGVPTLLTARDEHPMTGAIARLLHEDLVTVTELAELTLDETRTLLSRRFSVEPRPETLQHLYERTRGNPLFLRELVIEAERAGRVHVDEHGATVETANVPAHVLESVSGRLRVLTDEQRSIVELVAVAQLWPRAAVLESERNAVIDLLDSGVLVPAEPAEAGYLHLAHSLYAEAILARLSAVERADRRRTAAKRLLRIDEETVRFTALCLLFDAQGEIAADDLVWAAERAHRVGDHARAVQLADRALRDTRDQLGPATARAALARAVALSAIRGDDVEVDNAFARAAELARDDEARARVELRWGQHTAFRAHDPAAAVARATALVAQLDHVAADLLAPDLAKWRLMAGDASAVGQALDRAGADDSAAALGSALSQAMMSTMMGRVDEARAAVDAGRPLADRFADVQPHAGDLLDLSTFLVHVADGRIADARSFAEGRRLTPFADSAGIWSYALALVALHSGRLSDAAPLAALAVQQLRWRDFTGLVGPALALAATVHAQRGELDRARDLLAQLADAHRDDVKVVLQTAEAEAWIAVHDSQPERAVEVIATAVGRGLELGHLLLASLTASVAVRIGGASVVEPLTAAAAQASSSALTAAIAELASAAARRDAAGVIAVVPTLDRAGLGAVCHDAVAQAVDWAGDDRMLQRRARVMVADLARVVEAVRTSASARLDFGLTEREWLIAQAAARRERSREIADRLGVSVRTVDNHLASVYRKLGISGRGELEEELREQL